VRDGGWKSDTTDVTAPERAAVQVVSEYDPERGADRTGCARDHDRALARGHFDHGKAGLVRKLTNGVEVAWIGLLRVAEKVGLGGKIAVVILAIVSSARRRERTSDRGT
jgi:hypothetical protein